MIPKKKNSYYQQFRRVRLGCFFIDIVPSRVCLFPFRTVSVRIRGQGARVPLGWSVSRVYARLSAL